MLSPPWLRKRAKSVGNRAGQEKRQPAGFRSGATPLLRPSWNDNFISEHSRGRFAYRWRANAPRRQWRARYGRGNDGGAFERVSKEIEWLRSALVNEPRGSDVIVGALLCEPQDRASTAGVIFFNNVLAISGCAAMDDRTVGVSRTFRQDQTRIAPDRNAGRRRASHSAQFE